jgi:hypothetical protein
MKNITLVFLLIIIVAICGCSDEKNDTKDSNNIELHIIDWEGNPIYKLFLDQRIEVFSVDFDSGFMYGISKVEEKLYRYDITDIL